MGRSYLVGCVKTDATSNDCVHSTHEVAGNVPAHKESGKDEGKTEDQKTEATRAGSTEDPEDMKVRLQILLHILETSQDAEEKKATLQQISHLAEAMKDIIRIELEDDDGDSSDCHSTVSSSEPLLDIPLPDQPFSQSKTPSDADLTGIPLPGSSPVKRTQSTLFFNEDSSEIPPLPPLPPESTGRKEARSSGAARGKTRDGVEIRRSSKSDVAERCLEYLRDNTEEGALQTNTSLGLITLHVNRKLVPRLSRASVFDLNDENAKEIGRKLLRLKKLKKLRKMEEVTEHKIEAKERISMWKEELLGNGGLSLQSNAIAASLAGSLAPPEKKSEGPHSDKVDAVPQNPAAALPGLPAKLGTPSGEGVVKGGADESLIKDAKKASQKPLTFVKVQSKDEHKEYNWPVEMILSTKLSPKIFYSCNPLEFDFNVSNVPKDLEKTADEARNKDRKKKKGRAGSSHKRSSLSSQSTETQRKESSQKSDGKTTVRPEGGSTRKKPATETGTSNSGHVQQSKGRSESKNGQKRKSGQAGDLKKTSKDESTSKVHNAPTQKVKDAVGTDSKKTASSKDHAKGSMSEEKKRKDQKVDLGAKKTKDITLEKDSTKDGGRKRKLSDGDSKQLTRKKTNVQLVSKSVEMTRSGSGRVSDFEDVDLGTSAGKWDTSSDSEPDLAGPSSKLPAGRTTSAKVEVSRRNDRRERRSRSSSERDTSSSRERRSHDSDDDSQRSRSHSRSYSSRSYYSTDRSCSYSTDSDYHRRHSRSSTRSRSRRRSSSYSDRSYRSKSRSYARSRRTRSRSGSRDRFRSYSTYSRSSRSYSRSRSRSKSRSYRRYSRSFDKRTYDRRLRRSDSNQVHARTKKQEHRPETKSKGDVHSKSNRKSDELLLTTISKSDQSKEISSDVSTKASSGDTTVSNTNEKIEKVASDDKGEVLQSDAISKPESDAKDTLSIPLPLSSKTEKSEENGEQSSSLCSGPNDSPNTALSFIGPTLPVNHPLAHVQDIPVPKNEQFQPIGPNDPLVFKKPLLPPPPPPSFLTEPGSQVVGREPPLPPRPRSPPPLPNDWSTMEDIFGDEDPIPHMLDMGAIKPAMIIPPEQADQYRALQQQAQQHARQRMRQEAGIDEEEEEEEPSPDEAQLQQQLIEEMMLEQAQQNATFLAAATPQQLIHIPQQQLIGSALGSAPGHQVVVGGAGFFQMPVSMQMQMVSTGHPHGLMTLAPSMVPVHPQTGTPMMIAAQQSGAMSALIRAHEAQAQAHAQAQAQAQAQAEAAEEAEAQAKAQASIFQAHPHHEYFQIVQMPGGGRAVAIPAGQSFQHALAMSGLRSAPSAALHQVHPHGMIPVHAVNHPSLHPQQTLVQSFPYGLQMRVGLSPSVMNAPQVLAGAGQPQGMPLLIDSSGNILVPRLLRQGHL